MNLLFVLLTAMVISMVIIPVMIKAAPYLGMVDLPDPRKVHAAPIPRVGGVGIVIGSLIAIFIWLPMNSMVISFIAASSVLFIFGALDDSFELGHYVKFIGQFVAVGIIIYFGDVWVRNIPFVEIPLSPVVGKVFSFIAIVGMINAINHSDGLDGLAGGESLLTMCCIAYLSYIVDGMELAIFTAAIAGGVLGFIRFNNHPAQIFMGDSGSQFLGFGLAVLVILLTQEEHTAISMALPLLILGLPVIDIVAVFAQRIYHKMNWFRASKNHIHHRLLELDFDHYQSVVIIYSIQIIFVILAVLLRYESDSLILLVYLCSIAGIFGALLYAEHTGWKNLKHNQESQLTSKINSLRNSKFFTDGFYLFLKYSIPLYFLLASLVITGVSIDFAFESLIIILLLAVSFAVKNSHASSYIQRIGIYALVAVLTYLVESQDVTMRELTGNIDLVYFALLALIIFVIVRYARQINFTVTPFDYLMVILVLIAGVIQQNTSENILIAAVVVKSVILFYGCELLINSVNLNARKLLSVSAAISASVILLKSSIL